MHTTLDVKLKKTKTGFICVFPQYFYSLIFEIVGILINKIYHACSYIKIDWGDKFFTLYPKLRKNLLVFFTYIIKNIIKEESQFTVFTFPSTFPQRRKDMIIPHSKHRKENQRIYWNVVHIDTWYVSAGAGRKQMAGAFDYILHHFLSRHGQN